VSRADKKILLRTYGVKRRGRKCLSPASRHSLGWMIKHLWCSFLAVAFGLPTPTALNLSAQGWADAGGPNLGHPNVPTTLNGLHQSDAPCSGKACDSCVGKQGVIRRKVSVPNGTPVCSNFSERLWWSRSSRPGSGCSRKTKSNRHSDRSPRPRLRRTS